MDQLFIKLAGKLKNKGNKIILSTISKEYTKSKNVKYDIKKKNMGAWQKYRAVRCVPA